MPPARAWLTACAAARSLAVLGAPLPRLMAARTSRHSIATSRRGNTRGDVPFRRGALHHLLSNRTYIGEVVHHGKIYPCEHAPIVDRELFDAVQVKLAGRTNAPLSPNPRRCVSLLTGMIRDEHGRPMSPVHTRNHGKLYGYYASSKGDGSRESALRLPAGDLDNAIRAELRALLKNPHRVRDVGRHLEPSQQFAFATSCMAMADTIAAMNIPALRLLLEQLGLQVVVTSDVAAAELSASLIFSHLGYDSGPDQNLHPTIQTSTTSWGHELRLQLDPAAGTTAAADANLIQLIARGFAARDELLTMPPDKVATTPPTQLRHIERTARLAYLAPGIIRAILDGRQPRQVTARTLSRLGALPLSWSRQRLMLGFPTL